MGGKRAEPGVSWRKNTNIIDAACPGWVSSSHQPGVDLNRNFPSHWGAVPGARLSVRNGTEPAFAIVGAIASIDLLPWQTGAVAIALGASDGTFDSALEVVTGTLPTAQLTAGRHLVYVQGTDAEGSSCTAGVLDAVFLDVIAADDAMLIDSFDSEFPTR